jgi:HSP20 family protein
MPFIDDERLERRTQDGRPAPLRGPPGATVRAGEEAIMKALIPPSGITVFRKEMDRLLDRFSDLDRFWGDEMTGTGAWTPDVDIVETQEAMTLKAEVPGIEPKDLYVSLENGVLTLKGEKKQALEQKEERLYRSERHYGSFARTLRIPANVDAAKVTAEFKNGVLTVVMPKTPEARGRAIPIKTD